MSLPREEYIEQAYFYRALGERIKQQMSTQDLLVTIREELLSTTRLPMAVDFMAAELRLNGVFAPAMERLSHYFTPFQTYVVSEAERERGMFDFTIAMEILQREAEYRAKGATPQGIFLYQFEAISRNRLGYDRGLEAVAGDSLFDEGWREWIRTVRRQIGVVDFADLIYVRSHQYQKDRVRQGLEPELERPVLFGEKEGQIALANRRKDPLLLFSALQRQLDYPAVPRHKPADDVQQALPALMRRMERLESRLRLVEEEQRGGIDLGKFYGRASEEDRPLE